MSSSRAQQREEAAPSPVTVTRATARDAAGPIPPRLPEVPSELQDPDLFLTEQEERELRRVFRFMASFAHRVRSTGIRYCRHRSPPVSAAPQRSSSTPRPLTLLLRVCVRRRSTRSCVPSLSGERGCGTGCTDPMK